MNRSKAEKKNNNEKNGKNNHMKIFIIFFIIIYIILFLKVKFYIELKVDKFNADFKLKICFIEINKKGGLTKRKKRIVKNKKKTFKSKNKKLKINEIKDILKYIEIDKLEIKTKIGLFLLFPTILIIPVVSTLIDSLKMLPLKKFKNFIYEVLPEYEKFEFQANVNLIFKIRIIDMLKIYIKYRKIYSKKDYAN